MKAHLVWTFLMLNALPIFSSISLAEEGKWTKKADMPTARTAFSTTVANGKIYAIGGAKPLPIPISTVEEYDPVTDKWIRKAEMPTKRGWLSTSMVNGKIYAIGGSSDPDSALSTVEEYDPLTDTWTKKAIMPRARRQFSTSVVNGKIYAIGGWSGWGVDISTVEEYNPITDTWRKRADMPTARYGLSTSVVNGKIYAIGGGMGGGVVAPRLFTTVEEYDPKTDTWTKKGNMPTPGIFKATAVYGKIYAIGNIVGGLSTIEEYDPETNKWTRKAEMPTRRWGFSISSVNGKIYVIGGGLLGPGNVLISTVEEYDTGLAGLGVEAKGKLVTSWGKLKAGID